ncbi:hypothetical protein [Actinomadura rubrisoli]|uniref:Uncharacterized protein n=1 Tax=Actinomadura rubrisoli TaxID=2530368 RepID=A0A4R5CE06_9ACTN|nr:hypothetical protein [Actinomadura rubrisoli]TDD97199.1 hypothetical protein E1298_01820 [Actinomadura rubrisoli]
MKIVQLNGIKVYPVDVVSPGTTAKATEAEARVYAGYIATQASNQYQKMSKRTEGYRKAIRLSDGVSHSETIGNFRIEIKEG